MHAIHPGHPHRAAAPPLEVELGPLPFQPLYLAPGCAFAGLALVVLLLAVLGIAASLERVTLACTRTGDMVTCEERVGSASAPRLRLTGPVASVVAHRTGGRYPETCLRIGEALSCGGDPHESARRIRALPPGGSVQLDASKSPSVIGLAVGGAFFLMLAVMAISSVIKTLGRGRRVVVRVDARSLEVVTARGKRTVVPRVPGEIVRAARLPRSRGSMPMWCVVYGDDRTETVLVEFMAFRGAEELEPFVGRLGAALRHRPVV